MLVHDVVEERAPGARGGDVERVRRVAEKRGRGGTTRGDRERPRPRPLGAGDEPVHIILHKAQARAGCIARQGL